MKSLKARYGSELKAVKSMLDKVTYLNDFTPAETQEKPVVDPQPKPTPDPEPTPEPEEPTKPEEPTETEEPSSEVSEDFDSWMTDPSRLLVTLAEEEIGEEEFGDEDFANDFAKQFLESIVRLRAYCD